MLYEKKKILIHRLIWLAILVFGIITTIIVATPKVEIIDDNGYLNNYYESINESKCEIEVTFNRNVSSGYITVAFYDSIGTLLKQEENYFFGNNGTISSTFYIDGRVASYKIISYSDIYYFSISSFLTFFIWGDFVAVTFFILSLLLSYKAYEYNGNYIIVYAGWYHHYITINNIKCDEHNTLTSWSAISLSCTLNDGTDIKATITLTNRISLKINNMLYTETKW